MRFLDRLDERRRLDRLRAPGLGVVWGRRRVGKTRLLVEWSRSRRGLYTVADQSAEAIQRRYLAETLAAQFPGFADVIYPDWRTLFHAVAREARAQTFAGPLVLDELPYLVAASPALPSVLQNWVDHEAKDAGVLLVLAGSSQRMMQGLVLDPRAPLFGRAAESFELEPISPAYIGEALRLADPIACIRAASVWGGIPWYWELAAPFSSDLHAAIDVLVLDPSGPLHREPDHLLLEEQPPAAMLRPLLDAIGAGAHRPSEIASRIGQPVTSLSRPLARLQELRLIRRELPFGEHERSSKRAIYKIADPFFRFWFRAVAPNRGLLAAATPSVRRALGAAVLHHVMAATWEDLCRAALPRLDTRTLRGAGPFGPAHRFWHGQAPEWDVVAPTLDDRGVLLGEAKWHEGVLTTDWLDRALFETMRRQPPSVGEREIVHALFVPRIPARLRRKQGRAVLIDAEAVLSALR